MVHTSFYSQEEVQQLGFLAVGKDVLISRKASFYSSEKIIIGDHVRIDDFCIISGKITLGSYIHISAYTGIWAGESGIVLEDFVTISGRCNVYGKTDDYSGMAMTNPMVPEELVNIQDEQVIFRKFSIIGCASTVLPGVEIAEGTAIGSMSLVKKNTLPWMLYAGVPIKAIRKRERKMEEMGQLCYLKESGGI